MSKGSNRRKEDLGKVWDNWDQIFGKKTKQPYVPPPLPTTPTDSPTK